MPTLATASPGSGTTLSTLIALADDTSADGRIIMQLGQQENAILLPDSHALNQWLANHARSFLLLSAAEACLPALRTSLAHQAHCLGALLLSPGGQLADAHPLPFPSLTVCHPPHISQPRLTSTVAFAHCWGSRLHTLAGSGNQAIGELRLLLRALREHTEGWPQGRL